MHRKSFMKPALHENSFSGTEGEPIDGRAYLIDWSCAVIEVKRVIGLALIPHRERTVTLICRSGFTLLMLGKIGWPPNCAVTTGSRGVPKKPPFTLKLKADPMLRETLSGVVPEITGR